MNRASALCFALALLALAALDRARAAEYTLAVMVPFTGWDVGTNSFAAIPLAIQRVNERDDVLPPNTTLSMLRLPDPQCDSAAAVESLLSISDKLQKRTEIAAVLGPGCSSECEPTGLISRVYNTLELSYACQSPVLSNKGTFPTFARAVGPSSLDYSAAMVALVQHNGWRECAVFSSTEPVFDADAQELLRQLALAGVKTHFASFRPGDSTAQPGTRAPVLQQWREQRLRVFFVYGYGGDFRDIMLTMLDLGMRTPEFAVLAEDILPEYALGNNSWMGNDGRDADAARAFDGTLSCTLYHGAAAAKDGKPTAYGQFLRDVAKGMAQYGYPDVQPQSINPFVGYLYDSVFLYAHGLAAVLGRGEDPYNGTLMRLALSNVTFEGITGTVKLDEQGDGRPNCMFLNLGLSGEGNKLEQVRVSNFYAINKQYEVVALAQFGGGSTAVPVDIPPPPEFSPSLALRIPFLVLACLMLLVTACVLIAVIVMRNHRVQWGADKRRIFWGWTTLALLLVGLMGAYADIILFYLKPDNDGVCVSQLVLAHLAAVVVLAAMFARMWHISKIFSSSYAFKRFDMTESKLTLLILALVLPFVIYLIVWQSVDPWVSHEELIDDDSELWYKCQSDSKVPLWVLIGIEAGCLAVGVYLVWRVSALPSKFNEAKHIGLSIYNMVLVFVMIFPMLVGFDLQDKPDIIFLIKSAGILFVATFILCALFGPKFIAFVFPPKYLGSYGHGSQTAATKTASTYQKSDSS